MNCGTLLCTCGASFFFFSSLISTQISLSEHKRVAYHEDISAAKMSNKNSTTLCFWFCSLKPTFFFLLYSFLCCVLLCCEQRQQKRSKRMSKLKDIDKSDKIRYCYCAYSWSVRCAYHCAVYVSTRCARFPTSSIQ